MTTSTPKRDYRYPDISVSISLADILCDSAVDGSLEDLTEENWTL